MSGKLVHLIRKRSLLGFDINKHFEALLLISEGGKLWELNRSAAACQYFTARLSTKLHDDLVNIGASIRSESRGLQKGQR